MPKVTLSMIVKNEEKYLSGCLESVKNIVDEIIIVDTGSTDETFTIAEKYNAQIYKFDWVNDFAAARNYALSKSSGDYILYLDADERLSPNSIEEIKRIINNGYSLAGYNCTVESPSEASGGENVMQYIRFFSNHSNIKFEGKAHEQIEDSLLTNGYSIYDSQIKIIHLGYDVSESELKSKAKRNLEILLIDFEQIPNSYKSFQIGQTYVVLGEMLKSEQYFIYAIEHKNLKDSHLAHCYRYLAAIESNVKNNLEKSLDYVNAGLKISPKQPLLNIIASNVYLRMNKFSDAEEFVRKAYNFNEEIHNSVSNEFEIKISQDDLINHVLNIAMLSCNTILFNDFYKNYNNEDKEAGRNRLLVLFNSVFNNYSIDEDIIEESYNIISKEFIPAFVFSLSKYKNVEVRIKLLERMLKLFPEDVRILNMLGNSFVELNSKDNAFKYFEISFEKNQNDQALLFSLITLSVELDYMDKLVKYLNTAELIFKDNNAILEKLSNIKTKLDSIPK